LEAVTVFSLLADHVHGFVNDLCALCVVALGPAVAGAVLAEDHVVWAEKSADGSPSDRVNHSWLQVDEDGPGDKAAALDLAVVNIGTLELQVRVTMESACRVDAMLVRDDLPELGADLVAALACLYVNDFSHFDCLLDF